MKRLIQITFLAVLSLFTNVFSQVHSSKWQEQPIIIDGDGSDWGSLPRFFNAESNIKYEFRNDSRNLYFILKAADRATQMQLLRAGFSIRFKIKTTPPIRGGIIFPALKMAGISPIMMNQEGRTDKLADKSMTRPEFMPKDTAVIEGFKFLNGTITSENMNKNGVCFARSKSNRELSSYEVQIPFREFFGDNFNLENVANFPIQLQVMINDLSQNEMKKMRGKMGGGMRGGNRGGTGEGRGMGRMNDEGGMEGGGIGGSEIGEMPGQDMENQMQSRGGFSMERKSFSIDFKLSTGK
jgi:hypothetical protein